MNTNDPRFELIRRCHDDEASTEELAQLDSLLREDTAFRQAYVRYINLDVALSAVAKTVPMPETTMTPSRPRRNAWISWRPLTAAAAGIVFGMFCTSMVFAYVAPSLGKVITLLQESFESGPAPWVTGVPLEPGRWSSDYTEVVSDQQGVKPASGKKMLRFLRADFEGKPRPEGSYAGDIYRLVDMRPYRKEFSDGGAVAQLSAAFNAFEFPAKEAYGCSISLFALDAETAMNGSTRSGQTLNTESLAMARNSRLKLDRNPASWQRVDGELRLPPSTDFLLIHISLSHAPLAQHRVTFDGHYLDDMRLILTRRAPMP